MQLKNNILFVIVIFTNIFYVSSQNSSFSLSDSDYKNSDNFNSKNITTRANALHFDGVDDYIEIQVNESLIPNEITVELWAKSDAEFWNSMGSLISLREKYVMHPYGNSKSMMFVYIEEYYYYVENKLVRDITQWHHYAGTFDGNLLKLYVNGQLVAIGKNQLDKSKNYISNLRIGSDTYAPEERFFGGTIDEIRIWNYARSQNNIKRTMNLELLGNEKGLVAYYTFNQGIANQVNTNEIFLNDKTGKNNGILYNFSLAGHTSNWINSGVAITGLNYGTDLASNFLNLTNFFIFLAVVAIILLLLLFRIWQQKKNKKNLEKEVSIKTKELVQENIIKDALISEIHHRVKNNLQTISSLIYFQMKALNGENQKNGLASIQARVNSMAAIHEMLYSNNGMLSISLKVFIDDLINFFTSMFNNDDQNISFKTNIEDVELNITKSITLGLIISEIITNSIKYAFAETENPEISINIYIQFEKFVVIIKDNGCGIDENVLINKDNSLGFKLMNIFARQLEANFEIGNNNGLEYNISFNLI